MPTHSIELRRTRLLQAEHILMDPTANLQMIADTWGVSKPAASTFLKRWRPELSVAIFDRQRVGSQFTREEALDRLLLIRDFSEKGYPKRKIAALLGISHPALITWLSRWVEDGDIDLAISDLQD